MNTLIRKFLYPTQNHDFIHLHFKTIGFMPRAPKNLLIFIAGILWISVGIFLMKLSSNWISDFRSAQSILEIVGGLLLGTLISYFGFSGLANKNISRINEYEGKVCIWAFQKWQSYLLIVFMMSLGIFLRTSSHLPKYILILIYIGIGFGLFTASFRYFLFLYRNRKS